MDHRISQNRDKFGVVRSTDTDISIFEAFQDNSILLYQVVPSASKIEAEILREFELNLDHPGGK